MRARDLGITLDGTPGPLNAITDVPGVEIGMVTVIQDTGDPAIAARTGVTAVLPLGRDGIGTALPAAVYSLNGNGELTGSHWLRESGGLSGPVMITNTHAVGSVHRGVIDWTARNRPELAAAWLLPVVAETWDGYLNSINEPFVTSAHAEQAIDAAVGGPVSEGSFGGGMPVWLHGEHFSHDLHVRFGSAGASSVNVISHNLIKCQAPACFAFSGQARHEVTISLVVASTSAPVPGSIPFVYVHGGSGGGFSGAMGSVPAPPFELLRRLLHSLERAQAAAAAAAATSHLGDSSSTDLDLGLSAFSAMDEHGFSLAEYADELKLCLLEGGHAQSGDASELQSQLGDLATVLKRERLASSLARRPSVDILRQSNILPDHTVDERREALLHSLANRPGLESLQQRHILGYTADEKQEQLAKRKRLEGFLAERPTPEQVMTSF